MLNAKTNVRNSKPLIEGILVTPETKMRLKSHDQWGGINTMTIAERKPFMVRKTPCRFIFSTMRHHLSPLRKADTLVLEFTTETTSIPTGVISC